MRLVVPNQPESRLNFVLINIRHDDDLVPHELNATVSAARYQKCSHLPLNYQL